MEEKLARLQNAVYKFAGWQGIDIEELWGSDYELLEEGDLD